MAKDFKAMAQSIVDKVGGKDNIHQVLHCVTRLRFNLNDKSAADQDALKKIPGVLGVVDAGVQLQVVIGPDVDKVYDQVCAIAGVAQQAGIDENLDAPKEKKKITPKSIALGALDGLSGTMAGVIPAIVACAFFKMATALLGPQFLNVMQEGSDLYTLFTFVGDSGFYFFPVLVGYSAAKKFGANPIFGILLGAILIHPTFVQMATEQASFTVFGIPCLVQNYSSSILPAMLSVWVMSYVERFCDRIFPASIRGLFTPTVTILVMLPITLCVLGPAGAYLGNYVVAGLFAMQNTLGAIGIAIVAGLYPLLVMTGMHMIFITALFQVFATQGYDAFGGPATYYCSFACMGVGIGAFLRIKNKEQKALAAEFAITQIIAGTSEPTLYGICTRYKRPFIGLLGGGFIGGLVGSLMGAYSPSLVPSSNVFAVLGFAGGTTQNFIAGVTGCVVSLVAAAALTYFFGFSKDSEAFDTGDAPAKVATQAA